MNFDSRFLGCQFSLSIALVKASSRMYLVCKEGFVGTVTAQKKIVGRLTLHRAYGVLGCHIEVSAINT